MADFLDELYGPDYANLDEDSKEMLKWLVSTLTNCRDQYFNMGEEERIKAIRNCRWMVNSAIRIITTEEEPDKLYNRYTRFVKKCAKILAEGK